MRPPVSLLRQTRVMALCVLPGTFRETLTSAALGRRYFQDSAFSNLILDQSERSQVVRRENLRMASWGGVMACMALLLAACATTDNPPPPRAEPTPSPKRCIDVGVPTYSLNKHIEEISQRWKQNNYLFVHEFRHNLESPQWPAGGSPFFTMSYDTQPGREYLFVFTAADGANDLALSLRDSEGSYFAADTRNIGNAFLHPPYIVYPGGPAPAKVELRAEIVKGNRCYAVPVAVVVYSRLK